MPVTSDLCAPAQVRPVFFSPVPPGRLVVAHSFTGKSFAWESVTVSEPSALGEFRRRAIQVPPLEKQFRPAECDHTVACAQINGRRLLLQPLN